MPIERLDAILFALDAVLVKAGTGNRHKATGAHNVRVCTDAVALIRRLHELGEAARPGVRGLPRVAGRRGHAVLERFLRRAVHCGRHGATEVLVDIRDGGVTIEDGPAMMWNTTYGMHPSLASGLTREVSSTQARSIAQLWLDDQRPGLTAGEPEEFLGYVTVHTGRF